MSGRLLTKTSSPKLSVPQLRVAISGLQRSGWARSSRPMPTAPPVEVCTMTSLFSRIRAMASAKSSRDCEGVPSGLRTWRWTTEAPASRQRAASSASSAAVTGSQGVCWRVVSAPTMAAVRMSSRLGGVTMTCGGGVMMGRGSGRVARSGAGAESAGRTRRGRRCSSAGTTQVPSARQTTMGSAKASADEGTAPGSRRLAMTLRASKAIPREVLPTRVMTPVASM